MFYKKINLPLLPFAGLLLMGGECPNRNQAAPSTASGNKEDTVKDNLSTLFLSSCKPLKNIKSMSGGKDEKRRYFLQVEGVVKNPKLSTSEGQLGFILLPSGVKLEATSSIVKKAISDKGQVEKLITDSKGDAFFYWNKVNKVGAAIKKSILQVEEKIYKKLSSKKHVIYLLYLAKGGGAPQISTKPCKIDISGQLPLPPNLKDIGLEAMDPIQQQTSNGIGWLLKGKIADAYAKEDAKVGFICFKKGVDSYSLVQKAIDSEGKLPDEPTSYNGEMVIVPGQLRDQDPRIVHTYSSTEASIQEGNFNVICYWAQNGHYYFSQNAPSSITFTGSSHGLTVSDLKLYCQSASGNAHNIKSDFTIDYSLNGQVETLPSNLKKSIVFIPKGAIWRTATLESLFEKSQTSNSSASITDDGTICLLTDSIETTDKAYIDFFSHEVQYQYFACLFSTEDNKLKFYTQKEEVTVEEKEIGTVQPPKPKEEKVDEPKITLNNTGANITFSKKSVLQRSVPTFTPPVVNIEPSGFDKNKFIHRGFVIAKAEDLNGAKMDEYSAIINNFINEGKDSSYEDSNKFLILKEEYNAATLTDNVHKHDIYKKGLKGNDAAVISYWAQYNNKIIWSKPVSIEVIW